MTKRKPDPFHMRKKLELAHSQGYYDGYMEAWYLFEEITQHVDGIGPVLQKRMMDEVRKVATQRALEKVRKE